MKNTKIQWRVLLFPAGIENGLEILNSLKHCKEVKLFAATDRSINHSEYVFNEINYVRNVSVDGWIDDINKIIDSKGIDFIYPANSYIIDKLNENRDKINCRIALPEAFVIETTRSKRKTINLLKDKVAVPYLYNSIDEIDKFPVFIKPDSGYGSQDTSIIYTQKELNIFLNGKSISSYVIQEYLPGREYSVDCFSNRDEVLFCAARSRDRIRMGTSMHSEIVKESSMTIFKQFADQIQNEIKISGAWFFQVKEDNNGILRLLEIDVRIAGTMALNRVRGINFPLLTLYHFSGYNVKIMINKYDVTIDRCLKNRYKSNVEYNTVFVDLDDTLIINRERLNLELIQFLYQCINNEVRIVLVSKNLEENKMLYLEKFRIKSIFDEIVWLNELDKKSNFIEDYGFDNAIFIDDSFSQRVEVFEKLGIPTFDTSMIEMLLDDRY